MANNTPQFSTKFGVYHGDTTTWEQDGFELTATIHHDDASTAEGPSYIGKILDREEPGAIYLGDFGGGYRGSQRWLRLDGWRTAERQAEDLVKNHGYTPEDARREGEKYQAQDVERVRAWLNDEWHYVGVAVVASLDGVELTGEYDAALWGIENDSGDYFNEVAAELADEAIAAAEHKLDTLLTARQARDG